ncbi:hypothetical protein BH24ACT3_BH24ACT3_07550 [soil metagenome]
MDLSKIRTAIGVACAVVAVAAVLVGWVGGPPERPDLDADGARRFTAEALADAGLDEARVGDDVRAGTFDPEDADTPPLDVWRTEARLEGGDIELAIDRETGRAVELNDAIDGDNLLTDDQFDQLGAFSLPFDGRRDWFVEQAVASVAAVFIVGLASSLAGAERRLSTPHVDGRGGE